MINYLPITYHLWLWVKYIPSRIETLENYQLDEFLALADHLMRDVNREKANLLAIHSEERVNAIKWDDENEADSIRIAVQAEKERRRHTIKTRGAKRKKRITTKQPDT